MAGFQSTPKFGKKISLIESVNGTLGSVEIAPIGNPQVGPRIREILEGQYERYGEEMGDTFEDQD